MNSLRTNLREARIASGLSAEEASEKIGCHFNSLLAWERGDAEPLAKNIIKLSKLYGKDPDYLLAIDNDNAD